MIMLKRLTACISLRNLKQWEFYLKFTYVGKKIIMVRIFKFFFFFLIGKLREYKRLGYLGFAYLKLLFILL